MFSADDSSEEISARALSEPNTEINENTSGTAETLKWATLK